MNEVNLTTYDDLHDVKVGDVLIIVQPSVYASPGYTRKRVTKITKTQVSIDDKRFLKRNGREVADVNQRANALIFSDARWQECERLNAVRNAIIQYNRSTNRLQSLNWRQIDPETVRQVVALLGDKLP